MLGFTSLCMFVTPHLMRGPATKHNLDKKRSPFGVAQDKPSQAWDDVKEEINGFQLS
jgi:hypothetical protein